MTNIIFKYRDWENDNHRNIIIKNELYLPSPSLFNDPFDCRIVEDFTLLKTEKEKELYIEFYLTEFAYMIEESNYSIDDIRNIMRKDFSNMKEYMLNTNDELIQAIHSRIGVFTACKNWTNILIWSHYANNHKGFCVGLSTQELINHIKPGSYGEVIYDNEFPRISPFEIKSPHAAYKSIFTKAEDWSYENEIRFAKTIENEMQRLITFSDSTIREIILGVFMSEKHKQELIEICKSKSIKVFQARLSFNKYSIERFEI